MRVEAHDVEALPEAREEILRRELHSGDLGGDEHLGAGKAAPPDRLADIRLGLVGLGRVDMAVADLQRREDRLQPFLAGAAEGAQARAREFR